MSGLASQVKAQLNSVLAQSQDESAQLNNALRLLSKWRSVLIQNTLLQQQGTSVMQGPLVGMNFLAQSAEGCNIAKLLGCYEQPLQPFIEAAIEGAERELLDPNLSPALKGMNIIVESHECLIPGITQLLIDRFKDSHQITLVQDDGQRRLTSPPQWFLNLAHQLLATWEWRSGPTPWLVMVSKLNPT